ncbi:GntR family transcriptional regulator [Janibacter sp. GXQ6167]|uniref:GntR family transcriptional regulator n=1 Tax=Janibacter sp. GXQ6167 TaxID=3240791 RepID=UPI003524C3EC
MPVPTSPYPPRRLLRDDVLVRLREAIVDGTLAPGEQLRDIEVATWLGVSRTPVREALLHLGEAGLVKTAPGRSTTVAAIDTTEVADAQAVVASMHHLCVEAAIGHLTPADLAEMRAANERFAQALADGDPAAALAADDDFHAVPVRVSGNAAAATVLEQFGPVVRRLERLRFSTEAALESVTLHADLVALCESGDREGALATSDRTWHSLRALLPDATTSTERPDR